MIISIDVEKKLTKNTKPINDKNSQNPRNRGQLCQLDKEQLPKNK